MPPYRRRELLQRISIVTLASICGCSSLGRDEEKIPGTLQIENEADEQHQIQVTISELVPRTETNLDTPKGNPSPGTYQEETYEVAPDEILLVTNLNELDGPGYIMVSATADTGATTERWITLRTRFVWTLVIKPEGNLSWKYTGIE